MNDSQKKILAGFGTDVDGAIYRFGGNEKIYVACMKAFLEDDSMLTFRDSFAAGDWEAAAAAVHTLKGTAGNMGFEPLMQAARNTLSLLRDNRYGEAEAAAAKLEAEYRSVTDGIERFYLTVH